MLACDILKAIECSIFNIFRWDLHYDILLMILLLPREWTLYLALRHSTQCGVAEHDITARSHVTYSMKIT